MKDSLAGTFSQGAGSGFRTAALESFYPAIREPRPGGSSPAWPHLSAPEPVAAAKAATDRNLIHPQQLGQAPSRAGLLLFRRRQTGVLALPGTTTGPSQWLSGLAQLSTGRTRLPPQTGSRSDSYTVGYGGRESKNRLKQPQPHAVTCGPFRIRLRTSGRMRNTSSSAAPIGPSG